MVYGDVAPGATTGFGMEWLGCLPGPLGISVRTIEEDGSPTVHPLLVPDAFALEVQWLTRTALPDGPTDLEALELLRAHGHEGKACVASFAILASRGSLRSFLTVWCATILDRCGFQILALDALSESRRAELVALAAHPGTNRQMEAAPPYRPRGVVPTSRLFDEAQWRFKVRKYWSPYLPAQQVVSAEPFLDQTNAADSELGTWLEDVLDVGVAAEKEGPTPSSPRDLPVEELRGWLSSTGMKRGVSEDFAHQAIGIYRGSPFALRLAQSILGSAAALSESLTATCARVLFEAGEIGRAEALLAPLRDADARVLAADVAKARGETDAAVHRISGAISLGIEVLGAAERSARWRRAVFRSRRPRRTIALEIDGVRWNIAFASEPVLGRADADIAVAAPTVSRRHLRFLRDGEGRMFVEDLRSAGGTFLAGARIDRAIEITGPLSLDLSGAIPCRIRPAEEETSRRQLLVEVADSNTLTSFGSEARLAGWTWRHTGTDLVTRRDEPFEHHASVKGERITMEHAAEAIVAPGDVVTSSRSSGPRVTVLSESFEGS